MASEKLSYITSGQNSSPKGLLFVHGTPGSKEAFEKYYSDPDLKNQFKMVSVDRVGFGDKISQRPVDPNFKNQSKAILQVVDLEFKNKEVTCVGHSYGATLCLYMMTQKPEVFQNGVLISGVYNPNRKILRWYNFVADWWIVKWVLSKPLINSNEEMKGLKEQLYELKKALPKLKSKIHLIHGDKDKIVPVEDSKWLYKNMDSKHSKKSFLNSKDSGHFIIWKSVDLIKSEIIKTALEN